MPILRPGAGTLAVLALCSHFACLECLPIAPTPSRSSPLPPRLAASSKLLGLRGGGCFRGGREKQKRGEADERKALEVAAAAAAAKAENAGFMGSLSVVFYLLTSLTLTLMNKLIFSQFQFPLFVTEFQVKKSEGECVCPCVCLCMDEWMHGNENTSPYSLLCPWQC